MCRGTSCTHVIRAEPPQNGRDMAICNDGQYADKVCSRIQRGQRGTHADVAQLVAHHLAKVRVASSSLVIRSSSPEERGRD